MDIVLWILIIACFIVSYVGLVYPIIPSVVLIWIGALIYHFGINASELGWITWTMLVLMTIVLFVADYLANLYFVDKAGGTKWGTRAATVGLIVGSFIIPPFGVIIVPFALVLLVELIQKNTFKQSIKVAFATLVAFLSGTFAKIIIQTIMIIVFLLGVFV
ncbi:DUF456 domain-containing protein [Fredinandcohnia quinoae]|uniref:DUF456 domain-containing protein n=1 Tax=Fredinandcohnia quinoae TaxID=2918902 RepID=A0AAW5E2L2_9BACI|nr:DUF456 domain-containing protein [Fredinandcohnia sp. SECRCQ15]MCH1627137.1 DUF456 domain-containing protein [Fredinandcohnia sp. SECRCQ15]